MRMLILADDLSGAADCGVACAAAALKTIVALECAGVAPECDVLSVDANTRCMAPSQAAHEINRLVRHYAAHRDLLLFKKIDSTLRGNLAAELAAALSAYRDLRKGAAATVAVMAPAFPAIGRTTVNGMQLAHGIPLHELDIWRHQGIAGLASIPGLLGSAGLKCAALSLDAIRSGDRALAGQMNLAAHLADVLVCDAETDRDLSAVARASMQLASKPIWVGSAGLAYHLPRAAGFAAETTIESLSAPACASPVLFVIGSLSRRSIEQVRVLAVASQTQAVSVAPEVLLAGEESASWLRSVDELKDAMRLRRDVVLCPQPEPRVDMEQRPLLAAALARMAAGIRSEVGALVASGGETARAVLHEWGVAQLRLIGEFEKGIPVSTTENWNRKLPVITKAGDFGNAETLLNCCAFLHGAELRLRIPCDIGKGIQ